MSTTVSCHLVVDIWDEIPIDGSMFSLHLSQDQQQKVKCLYEKWHLQPSWPQAGEH